MRIIPSLLVGCLAFNSLIKADILHHHHHDDDDTLRVKIIVENPEKSEAAHDLLHRLKHDFKVHIDSIETRDTLNTVDTDSQSHASFESLKRTIKDLKEDSEQLWNLWGKLAGDKWDDTRHSLKDTKDQTLSKAYGNFYNVMNDIKNYYETLEKTAEHSTSDAHHGLAELLAKLKDTYKSFKEETKAKIEGVVNPSGLEAKLDETVQVATDLYDDATDRFLRIKEILGVKIDDISKLKTAEEKKPESDEDVSHESLKQKVKGLVNKLSDAWDEFKEKVGNKADKVDDKVHEKLHAAFDKCKEDIHTLHMFLNKDYVKLNKEARKLLNHFLDELTDQYGHLKLKTEQLAADIKEGAHESKMDTIRAYENALANYELVRGRIQNEIDYVTGKITKLQYETAKKARSKYEKLLDEAKSAMHKVGHAVKHPVETAHKALHPVAEKIREMYVDSINTFLELDSKLAPYWDDITGHLKHVKDKSSQKVRETFQNAIDDMRDMERMVSEAMHKHKGNVDQKIHDRLKHFTDKFHALKEVTKRKYHNWIHGKGEDKALDLEYDKARDEYLESKKLLLVEVRKYYVVELNEKNKSNEF